MIVRCHPSAEYALLIAIVDVTDTSPSVSTLYDLVANITHSSTAGTAREDTTWKVHVHTSADAAGDKAARVEDERWFQIQDLIVEEINKQVVFLGETYIQVRSSIFGRRSTNAKIVRETDLGASITAWRTA